MFEIIHDTNNQSVFIKIQKNRSNFENGIRMGFYKLGKDLVKTAKEGILNPPKTGKIYKIAGIKHQASAAGQYPANRRPSIRRALKQSVSNDARLAFSLGFNVIGCKEMIFGSKVKHGKFMQEGTKFIQPRPFLTLSVDQNQKNARKHFISEIGSRL